MHSSITESQKARALEEYLWAVSACVLEAAGGDSSGPSPLATTIPMHKLQLLPLMS